MSNAISYSRYSMYEKCPAQYNYRYLEKSVDGGVGGPAAQRGDRIHKGIEDYYLLRGELPEEVSGTIRAKLEKMREVVQAGKCTVAPEMEFALDQALEPTAFDAEDCYVRGFLDNVFIYDSEIVIHEYKTGKVYPEHDLQRALYGFVGLILFPRVEEIPVEGIYIDQNKVVTSKFMRAHLPAMTLMWRNRLDKMSIPIYPARPGLHCRWCPASKARGGPCQLG